MIPEPTAPSTVNPSSRAARTRLPSFVGALLLLGTSLGLVSGCNNKAPAKLTDRLWVSEMPLGPRDQVDAMVITEVAKRSAGSFYHGSVYQGSYDSFTWKQKGKDRGVVHMLQAQRSYEVRTRDCKPTRGFDLCVELVGDPTGVKRYQSRKRWAIPRRGKGAQALDVQSLFIELAEEDAELEALLDQAY
ncbi:DNA gyrase subunit B [Plesiocystis pacifica SIR-1]|uniref:DNA gyrase subunit B n=1 Tax=Plesiocystis pacifica SIR-1 TaxID=391625 RepID=A6G5S4_9BACT|nr:DNA gyrase subunit B [Plesiocystis pacifica SIR-1]